MDETIKPLEKSQTEKLQDAILDLQSVISQFGNHEISDIMIKTEGPPVEKYVRYYGPTGIIHVHFEENKYDD